MTETRDNLASYSDVAILSAKHKETRIMTQGYAI